MALSNLMKLHKMKILLGCILLICSISAIAKHPNEVFCKGKSEDNLMLAVVIDFDAATITVNGNTQNIKKDGVLSSKYGDFFLTESFINRSGEYVHYVFAPRKEPEKTYLVIANSVTQALTAKAYLTCKKM